MKYKQKETQANNQTNKQKLQSSLTSVVITATYDIEKQKRKVKGIATKKYIVTITNQWTVTKSLCSNDNESFPWLNYQYHGGCFNKNINW